jgi:hypothetical protein
VIADRLFRDSEGVVTFFSMQDSSKL